ncbi:MAG: winged helix-turn-helix transcriptional regulator [Planctomycetes bacterium]|nr:winged helix-turn-helix transcriptional regulator [Planctomycetota bacterium]
MSIAEDRNVLFCFDKPNFMATVLSMDIQEATPRLLKAYPAIFLACHQEHRRDPATEQTLSAHQGSILDHLDAIAPTSLTQLAEHMGVTPSTMSLHIDRLAAGNYVTRTKDPADKRRVLLLLTEAGLRIKQANSVLEPELVAALLSRLPEKQRLAGISGLELLAAAARELMAAHSRSRAWAARRQDPDPSQKPT